MAENKSSYTEDDLADTARMLGISGPERSNATIATAKPQALSNSDLAETADALGISLKNSDIPMPKPRPQMPEEGYYDNRLHINVSKPSASLENQIVSGMPIISPLFDRAVAATGAAISPLVPNADKRPSNFGDRYSKNLEELRADNRKYSEDNPVKSTLANLIGGGMLLGPVAGTKLGRLALGIEGPTVGSRIAQGVVGGTALSGADAALRGDDIGPAAIIGGLVGGGAPLLAEGVRSGTNALANAFWPRQGALKGINSTALSKLVGAMEGETPESVAAARERMGPAGFLGDLNTGMTDLAGGIADTPGGPGKQIIREAYRNRAGQQPSRIDQALTDASVPKSNIEDFKGFLTETRKAASDPLYEQFRSMQVHPTDALKAMIPRLEKAGAFNMAEELSGIHGEPINKAFFTTGPQKEFPTTQSWDYVKRGLDRRIDQAYTAGDKTLARSLVGLKNDMMAEIEKTPAGKVWKQARTEFADRSAILDQIEAGRDTFLGGRSGLSVDELKEELKGLKGPELYARIVGMRGAADQVMGDTMRGDTTLRNKFLAPNNQEKLRLLLGEKKAAKLIKSMEQEKYLSEQTQNVAGGSQTTPKAERVNALKPPQFPEWNPDITKPLTLIPPHVLEQLRPSNIVDAWRGRAYGRAHEQLAPLLTTREGPMLQDLIEGIRAESTRRGNIANRSHQTGNALASLMALPGVTTARRELLPP